MAAAKQEPSGRVRGRTAERTEIASEWPIVVRGLTKRYREVAAADGVDLAVAAGSIHGLVGPNGAGKSTVLGSILGLVAPDAGEVTILGGARAHASARTRGGVAGFVDDPRFYPYLTARQNLQALGILDGLAAGARKRRTGDALERVGLAASADRKVAGYSLGMRQRLGLAATRPGRTSCGRWCAKSPRRAGPCCFPVTTSPPSRRCATR